MNITKYSWMLVIGLVFGACTTQFEKGRSESVTFANMSDNYRQLFEQQTREIKQYHDFNTEFWSQATWFSPELLREYRLNRCRQFQLSEETCVGWDKGILFPSSHRADRLYIVLSLHSPPPKNFLAEQLVNYWKVSVLLNSQTIRLSMDTDSEYFVEVVSLAREEKKLLGQYIRYVNNWSYDYLISVGSFSSNPTVTPQNPLQLNLASDFGKLEFSWP